MPIQQLDISKPILAGQTAQANRLALQSAEEERLDKAKIRGLREQAFAGDKSAIGKIGVINPQGAAATQKVLEGIQQASDEEKARAYQNAQQIIGFAAYADTPEKWEGGKKELKRIGIDMDIAGEYDENKRAYLIGFAKKIREITQGATQQLGGFEQIPGAPEGTVGQKDPATGKWTNIQKPEKGGIRFRSGDTELSVGGPAFEPEKKVVEGAQKGIVSADEHAARIARIDSLYDPNFMTYLGRAGLKLDAFREKAKGIPLVGAEMDQETKQKVRQFRRFTQGVNYEFNQYRKEITGAAAAVQELEDLKKAMFSEDLSPSEFEAAFDEFKLEIQRGRKINEELLSRGIKAGSPQYEDAFNDLYFSSDYEDVTGTEPTKDADARGQELMKQGLSFDQALKKLEEEGY